MDYMQLGLVQIISLFTYMIGYLPRLPYGNCPVTSIRGDRGYSVPKAWARCKRPRAKLGILLITSKVNENPVH